MDRPRALSAADRSRRIGSAGAALLLVLLAGACALPSLPLPPPEDQPLPTPEETAPEEGEVTLSGLPADEAPAPPAAHEPAVEDVPAATPEPTQTAARVGLLLPLSGRYASEGETLLRAAQLALFDTADEHFLLLPRDTGGTATGRRVQRSRCWRRASTLSWARCSPRG